MLNERKSFETMVKAWGHWCVLRQFLRGEPRSAWYDSLYEEASRNAIQELTAGRPFVDHLARMIKRDVVPGFEKAGQVGVVATPGLFFYVQASVKPTPQDWILELSQREVRGEAQPLTPYKISRFYKVMDIAELRMEKGRLAYFRVRVEESQVGGAN
jgi:hypothetical protein